MTPSPDATGTEGRNEGGNEQFLTIYRRWALARGAIQSTIQGESRARGGFVDYVVNLHVEVVDEGAYAVAMMECPSGAFKGEGRAKIGQSDGTQHIATDLAHRAGPSSDRR